MSYAFNPLVKIGLDKTGTGGGTSSPDNFSVIRVKPSSSLTIPDNQQMLFKGIFRNEGVVFNYGMISPVEDNSDQENLWNTIPEDKTVFINENKTLFFKRIFYNYGILRNHGILEAI